MSEPGNRRWVLLAGLGSALGLGLIVAWAWIWVASARQNSLVLGNSTWIPALSFIAGDFKVHIDHVARLQAAGIDPYHKTDDWVCALYPYPPMIGRVFEWVAFFRPVTASRIWQASIGIILAAGTYVAWRTRRSLGLVPIPLALMVGLILFSTPAMFAMERGQCDPLVIVPMIAAAWLLRREKVWAEVIAGGLLGWCAWIKYYPGLAVVALLALGRWRGLMAYVAVAALIGIVDLDGFRESVQHGKMTMAVMAGPKPSVHSMRHSIVENWEYFDFVKNSVLVRIPGSVATAVLLLPVLVLVSRKIARSADPGMVLFPYFLWLSSIATFALPYSIDYNLATLPIATLAVWSRRDRPWVHLAILASVAWSQPFWLPVDGQIILGLKLGAIYAVGASIAARASETVARVDANGSTSISRPAFARLSQSNPSLSAASVPDSRRL